jgi:hypothetical protein
MDMRYYWVVDRVAQEQFLIYWRKGADNLADYFTKHHSPEHHRQMRYRYLTKPWPVTPSQALVARSIPTIDSLQRCVDPSREETDIPNPNCDPESNESSTPSTPALTAVS